MMDLFNQPDLVGFYALAAVAIFASLRVVIHANPVHAILSMIVSLLAVAGIFFILGASFAGALEIVVYAGAILVLFVFVIMMLNLGMSSLEREKSWLDAGTWAVPTGLTLIIAVVLFAMIGLGDNSQAVIGRDPVSAKMVGTALFSQYIMLVEIAALLLLGALVAAYHLGKRTLDDAIIDHDTEEKTYHPNVRMSAQNDQNNQSNDALKTTQPYEYHTVDPHDYVGKNAGKSGKEVD